MNSYKNFKYITFVLLFCILTYSFSQSFQILGDVNNDGTVDVSDIEQTIQIILGVPPNDYELWAADVNHDELIDVFDIVLMVTMILGIDCPDDYHPCFYNLLECCFDTTSHNFTWTMDTLGIYNSYLLDVAIINENDIWAAGEIKLDLYGYEKFNAVHWNGSEWEFWRIVPEGFAYSSNLSVFAFSSDDVWMCSTGPMHWNGEEWTAWGVAGGWPYNVGWIKAMWGTSSSDLYFIGNDTSGSNIVHYDGVNFEMMDNPTETWLIDIWGSPDGSVVWACGKEVFEPYVLLRLQNGEWEIVIEKENVSTFYPDSISGAMYSVWTPSNDSVYVLTSYSLYRCPANTSGEGTAIWQGNTSQWSNVKVRGNSEFDIITISEPGWYWHFNGNNWNFHDMLNQYDIIRGANYKNNVAEIVGVDYYGIFNSRGLIYTGIRER